MNYESLSDWERERFSATSLKHIGDEIQTLMSLRSRIAYARALLVQGNTDVDLLIDVLDGADVPVPMPAGAGEDK